MRKVNDTDRHKSKIVQGDECILSLQNNHEGIPGKYSLLIFNRIIALVTNDSLGI
jgi:hypothetical protein